MILRYKYSLGKLVYIFTERYNADTMTKFYNETNYKHINLLITDKILKSIAVQFLPLKNWSGNLSAQVFVLNWYTHDIDLILPYIPNREQLLPWFSL